MFNFRSMRTKVIRLKDKRYIIVWRRWLFWRWNIIEKRFLSRNNAEAYARRFEFKIKHPLRYKRLLRKYPREAFTGRA